MVMQCWSLLLPLVLGELAMGSEHYLNSFAIEVDGGLQTAKAVATDLDFIVDRELPNIGVYVLTHRDVEHRSRRSADHHLSRLLAHPEVRFAQQEVELRRVKRLIIHDKQLEMPIREIKDSSIYQRIKKNNVTSRDYYNVMIFNDPHYDDMWYLRNRGQSGGEKYLDLNVEAAWKNGYTGKGIVLCILDDGVDHTHPDLADNYDPQASTDLNDINDSKKDPMPNMTNPDNKHGTRCAGEIAAVADNNVCGVGVAYSSKIGAPRAQKGDGRWLRTINLGLFQPRTGVRFLDGIVTDSLEGEALSFNRNYIHVYSASWGPTDDGKTMEGPGKYASRAFMDGVSKGRNGLGSIFVWATGNGGVFGDNCNADGFTSRIETLSVGSISDRGRQPYFMENCTSTLAVVPTGGQEYEGEELIEGQTKLKVITTDVDGGCIENFQGTSSAAPLAAGCVALVLQAKSDLTWRDVQHIVVNAARVPSADSSWIINGAGYHVSNKFGFGLMDCGKMVLLAQDWKNVPEQHVCSFQKKGPELIEPKNEMHDTVYVDGCKDDQSKWIQRLEHVQVQIKLTTNRRGDVKIVLVSPAGTRSILLSPRPRDSFSGRWEFTFMSVHHWGEDPVGTWTLEIHSSAGLRGQASTKITHNQAGIGFVEEWELILYGTAGERYSRAFSKKEMFSSSAVQKAFVPPEDMVAKIKRDETKEALQIRVKLANTKVHESTKGKQPTQKLTDKDMQLLVEKLQNFIAEDKEEQQLTQVFTQQRSLEDKNTKNPVSSFFLHTPGQQNEEEPSNVKAYKSLEDENQTLLQELLSGLKLIEYTRKRKTI